MTCRIYVCRRSKRLEPTPSQPKQPMRTYSEATRAIVNRLLYASIPTWLLTEDELEHVGASPDEWVIKVVNGTRTAILR